MDQKTINQMKNLANAFNDIENGKQPSGNGVETGADLFETKKAMENILNKLSEIDILDYNNRDYSELRAEAEFSKNTQQYINDQFRSEKRMEALYGNPDLYENFYYENDIPNDTITKYVPPVPLIADSITQVVDLNKIKEAWILIQEDVKGMKNVKNYGIQNVYNKQTIIDGIMMQEAAIALLNILNNGGKLTNPKVLGIISYGIQYSAVLEDAIKSIKTRQEVLRESNYTRAAELDIEIAEHKKKAQELKERIVEFIAKGKN